MSYYSHVRDGNKLIIRFRLLTNNDDKSLEELLRIANEALSLKDILDSLVVMDNNTITCLHLVDFPWHESNVVQEVQRAFQQCHFMNITIAYDTFFSNISLPACLWECMDTESLILHRIKCLSSDFQLHPHLQKLGIVYSTLDATSCAHLARALTKVVARETTTDKENCYSSSNSSMLTRLELNSSRFLGHGSVEQMAHALENHPSLSYLSLYGCHLADYELSRLLRRPPPNLQELNISGNRCGNQTISALAHILNNNNNNNDDVAPSSNNIIAKKGLKRLVMFSCKNLSGKLNIHPLCDALTKNDQNTLQSWYLARNALDDGDMKALVMGPLRLKHTKMSLKRLDLKFNKFTDASLGCLATHFLQQDGKHQDNINPPCYLQVLEMSSDKNDFTHEGLEQVAQAIPNNDELEVLGLATTNDYKKMSPRSQKALQTIDLYLALNWGGAKRLFQNYQENVGFPLALWALVLARANRHDLGDGAGIENNITTNNTNNANKSQTPPSSATSPSPPPQPLRQNSNVSKRKDALAGSADVLYYFVRHGPLLKLQPPLSATPP